MTGKTVFPSVTQALKVTLKRKICVCFRAPPPHHANLYQLKNLQHPTLLEVSDAWSPTARCGSICQQLLQSYIVGTPGPSEGTKVGSRGVWILKIPQLLQLRASISSKVFPPEESLASDLLLEVMEAWSSTAHCGSYHLSPMGMTTGAAGTVCNRGTRNLKCQMFKDSSASIALQQRYGWWDR